MREPLVSIIVPIYNAQEALNRCIDSIINQDYKNIEVFLMDDGSKDASGKICDEYQKKDERIQVIHKENSGVSATRNMALDLAKGEYIQFLDADDWITSDSTKLFVRSALEHDCDMVIADFYRVIGERLAQKGDIDEEEVMTRQEFAEHMMENPADFYYGVLWNKFFKRELIEKAHLRMDTKINWCEDFLFNLEYIRLAKTFYALQAPIYYYVKTKGSLISQSMNISKIVKMKLGVFEYYQEFFKDVYDEEDYSEKKVQVYKFLVAAAKDSLVVPVVPGTYKLGKERKSADPSTVQKDGSLLEVYRYRKLLERYCQSIAAKNDLTLEEIYVLMCLEMLGDVHTLQEVADCSGMNKTSVIKAVSHLVWRGILKVTTDFKDKGMQGLQFLSEADKILADLETINQDFNQVRYQGFNKEERKVLDGFMQRMNQNMKEALK